MITLLRVFNVKDKECLKADINGLKQCFLFQGLSSYYDEGLKCTLIISQCQDVGVWFACLGLMELLHHVYSMLKKKEYKRTSERARVSKDQMSTDYYSRIKI